MALSVKVDLKSYPQGEPVGIIGIGVVNNGESVEVTPEGEAVFFSVNNNTIENVTKDQEGIETTGSAEFQPPEGWEPNDPYGVPLSESTYQPPEQAQQQPAPAPAPTVPQQPESGLPPETPPTEGGGE